jgi:hypothetical protein
MMKCTFTTRVLSCLTLLWAPSAACAAPEVCKAVAIEIEASLKSFDAQDPETHISIASAVQEYPAAGLDFGSRLDSGELDGFPLSPEERAQFDNAVALIYRAGNLNGLVMLDAVRGTANCHSPLLFSTASGSLRPLKAPAPAGPFDLCQNGGVALGAAAGSVFYAQTGNDGFETDEVKILTRKNAGFSESCTISANYELAFEAAESFCKEPALCSAFAARAAKWAGEFRSANGAVNDAALARAAGSGVQQAAPGELPLLGAAQSKLVPQPFRFDGPGVWFAFKGDPRVDFVRIGPAAEGPAGIASWKALTLIALYKGGQPAGSFVIEKRRTAFKSLSMSGPEK